MSGRETGNSWNTRRTLAIHASGAACLGVMQAVLVILPFLARQRFGATNWQTTVLTAAVPVTQFFTIFWHHVYARVSLRIYFPIIALAGCIPVALLGLATDIWQVMGLFILSALGGAGGTAAMSPLSADLLRSCYSPAVRGRAFGIITTAQFAAAMIAGQLIGWWSDHDDEAFRSYLPLVGLLMLTGLAMYAKLCFHEAFRGRSRAVVLPTESWMTPLRDMMVVLRADKRFAGYEASFMSYGVGWMICTALVPALATDRLHLNYTQYAQATVVAYQLTNLLLLTGAGYVADRVGPVRLAAGSFLWLTMYPLGLLLFAKGASSLLVMSVL
jgi:MFS family permease